VTGARYPTDGPRVAAPVPAPHQSNLSASARATGPHPAAGLGNRARPLVAHLTTTDISLALLLGPQLSAFAGAGFDVVGISAPGPFVARLEATGIRHIPLLNSTRSRSPARDAAAAAELFRLLRRLRPEILHTHNPKPGVYGRIAGRLAGVPAVVNTVHGLYATHDDPLQRRAAVYVAERIAAACSDAELVQNPEDLETLARLGVPHRRLRLLGNGVDLDRFHPPSAEERRRAREAFGFAPGEVVVGAVGRLVWEKGYAELFAAAPTVAAESAAARFVVAGPADPGKPDALSDADIAAAERSGMRFLGHRDEIELLYAALDVYVLASHREGFPRSAMEAASAGLPIVATDIRGCRQVVDDGATGLLVPARDPPALARAIGRLCSDAALRAAMGRRAREKAVGEFDQQRVIDITLSVYRELLARKKGAAA
jgi:glycosyltransferase involved in cell wall biosynthesis